MVLRCVSWYRSRRHHLRKKNAFDDASLQQRFDNPKCSSCSAHSRPKSDICARNAITLRRMRRCVRMNSSLSTVQCGKLILTRICLLYSAVHTNGFESIYHSNWQTILNDPVLSTCVYKGILHIIATCHRHSSNSNACSGSQKFSLDHTRRQARRQAYLFTAQGSWLNLARAYLPSSHAPKNFYSFTDLMLYRRRESIAASSQQSIYLSRTCHIRLVFTFWVRWHTCTFSLYRCYI